MLDEKVHHDGAEIKPQIASEEVERHEPLARFFAWRFTGTCDDDAVQTARIGIWFALKSYNPSRGSTFSSWASLHVRRELHRWRNLRLIHVPVNLPKTVGPKTISLSPELLSRYSYTEAHDEEDDRTKLKVLIARLPEQARRVIEARLAGTTLLAIARDMGLSRQRVHQIEAKAISDMRWFR